MLRLTRILVAAMIAAALPAASAFAQVDSECIKSKIGGSSKNKLIKLTLNDGENITGRLMSLDTDNGSISVDVAMMKDIAGTSCNLSELRQVSFTTTKKASLTWITIGTAGGLLADEMIGYHSTERDSDGNATGQGLASIGGGLLGGVTGFLLGLFLPIIGSSETVLCGS